MQTFRNILFLALLGVTNIALAQQTSVRGKVKDMDTGEPMPFVNIFFQGTTTGVTTNFDGYFEITTEEPTDSLVASYIGYQKLMKPIRAGESQTVNFQLAPAATALKEVEIVYGEYENPAWEVLRNVVKNKSRNDQRSLDAYEYESYSKIELDVDNISEKFKKKKIVSKILSAFDSMKRIEGDDGKPILPVFISETLSKSFFVNNPAKQRENILKTQLTGVAIEDGGLTSQVIGSSFQVYNLYENWISIADKDFISPIADSWKAFYDYELQNNEMEMEEVEGFPCYRITFKPKRPEDLAFSGTMWITDSTNHYALKQVELRIGQEANLNFIEKVQVQQTLSPVEGTEAWLPSKSRILIDIGEVRDDWAGMLAKFYVSNKNFVANKPKPAAFYEERVKVADDALKPVEKGFWQDNRHDTLSASEMQIYQMIDTLKKLPVVKTYVEVADIVFNGYKTIGKFNIGTYTNLYAFNNIEGHRFRLGVRTNPSFSKNWMLNGYLAYGTRDGEFKYSLEAKYLANRKHWLILGASRYKDIDQIGIYSDWDENSALFSASSRFGTLRRAFDHEINQVWVQGDIVRGLTQTVKLRNRSFEPLGSDYQFYYRAPENPAQINSDFRVTELILETRIAFKEKFIQYDNSRASLGTDGRPIIRLRALFGLNALGSDFEYQKYSASIAQNIRLGLFGRLRYELAGGYVPSKVPYPLLEAHLGNRSIFYNENSFNMMGLFEFVSDTYSSLRLKHSFEGMLLNRIPVMRKLKWRSFLTANALYGSVRQENIDIMSPIDPEGNPLTNYPPFRALGDTPYVEVGYGIENILRFIRVDFIHRLTYLEREDTNNFGVKLSVQFRL